MPKDSMGVINAHDAYSKREVLVRFNISQKFWDKMLDDGVPYTPVGHSRWVLGEDLLKYLRANARTKRDSESERD